MSIAELLQDYPVTYQTPVAWGEMDSYHHVNNVVYFRYFESARLAYFDQVGFADLKETSGIGPILASTSCRFRLPLRYPDQVTVGARVTDIGEDRFTMLYRIVSHELQAVAAEGEGMIVTYDYHKSAKARLPDAIRTRLEALG
ncbi:MAG: thioesterase family protein [Planctomycetota bacterium]|nr:thioesterase family protein [Planctomycetota bacterium]